MSTVNLNIFTGPYASITNRIQIRIYAQSAPMAIIASVTHAAPHTASMDTWSFPGLVRTNYLFRIFEIDAAGNIVQQLGGDMDVVPGSSGNINSRATEQITADITPGFVSGVNSVTFDGTGGTEDWRGFDIDTFDRMGTGPMKKGYGYSWVPGTGVLTLLQSGDVFNPNEWFNVQFAVQIGDSTDSVPTDINLFSTPKLIKNNYLVDPGADMTSILIVDPATNYLEIRLPDINTVVAGRVLTIEMRRTNAVKCMKLITFGADQIDWQNGRIDLYALPNESFQIYKFTDPAGPTNMWRILNPCGNFLRVGEQIFDDALPANVFNKCLFDGAAYDVFQYARIYNDHVLNLAPGELCNYDDWGNGSNNKKFSLANSTNPANANKFHIPDRRNTHDRNTDGVLPAGVLVQPQVGAFSDTLKIPKAFSSIGGDGARLIMAGEGPNEAFDFNPIPVTFNLGKENTVRSVISRKYLLL